MYGALFGIAVGDAFGVPFEFRSKEEMLKNPATEMIELRIFITYTLYETVSKKSTYFFQKLTSSIHILSKFYSDYFNNYKIYN